MSFSLFPRTVFKKESPISGLITVKELLGQPTLSVQGMIQSGGLVKDVWAKVFRQIKKRELKTVLILGLGGGTVVHLIKDHWPEAKIIGIEIDPEIIKIGNKFFGLDQVKGLEIIQADAFQWIKQRRKPFDLVLIDLYLGRVFPPEIEKEDFLKGIKKLLSKNSLAVFNRLKTNSTEEFEKKLKNFFSSVEKVKSLTNLFFLVKL